MAKAKKKDCPIILKEGQHWYIKQFNPMGAGRLYSITVVAVKIVEITEYTVVLHVNGIKSLGINIPDARYFVNDIFWIEQIK